jgi:hypothetical protein
LERGPLRRVDLIVRRRDVRLTQFEHYKLLAEELMAERDAGKTWVIFTDDDDLWHPTRTAHYMKAIKGGVMNNSVYVCIEATAELTTKDQPETWEDVDALLASGRGKVTRMGQEGDYHSYGVRLSTLAHFTRECNETMMKHKFCDMGFWRYLRDGARIADCDDGLARIVVVLLPTVGRIGASVRSRCLHDGKLQGR